MLIDDASKQSVGVLLRPDVQHIQTPRDQLARERHEAPVVFRLEAVAVVFLAVQGLSRVGREPFRLIEVIGVVHVLGEGKTAGILALKQGAVFFGDAAQAKRLIALHGREFPQGLDRGAQRPRTDRENEGRPALVTQLGQHPVARTGDQLAVAAVPDVYVAEVIVRAPASLGADDLVHPGLVAECDGFEFYHGVLLSFVKGGVPAQDAAQLAQVRKGLGAFGYVAQQG